MFAGLLPRLNGKSLVLASASPRRKEIFEKLGLAFDVVKSDFAEDLDKQLYKGKPQKYVLDNAALKARSVAMTLSDESRESVIVGCDTVVSFRAEIYEKPKEEQDAFRILSCNLVQQLASFYEMSKVTFGDVPSTVIRAYIATGEPLDKAGAYGIQGFGAALVEKIDGDFYNVMGFPLFRFTQKLMTLFGTSTS